MGEVGHKGYRLEKQSSMTDHLIAPSGKHIAAFSRNVGRSKVAPLVDGLDCGSGHKTDEQAFKYIARQYELLTTTRMEQSRTWLSKFVSHGIWKAIGVFGTAVATIWGIWTFLARSCGSGAP